MKLFRNLLEAINSLGKGKVLVSKVHYLFDPGLAFYQEDIFGDLELNKYKTNRDLGYGVLGRYISEFGVKYSEEDDDVFYNLGLISSDSLFIRSDDLFGILEKLDDSAKDLKKVLDSGPIHFVESSGKILSNFSSSFDFLVFSSFEGGQYEDGENLLISGVYEGKNTPDFSGFWKNLLFSNSGVYEKFLSVFDENFREYVLSSIKFYDEDRAKPFSLPFGIFSEDTRFLFLDKSDLGRRVGLVSIDQRLSSKDISEWFNRFVTSRRDISPEIIGCLDLYYYSGPNLKENVVLIPVELKKRDRKILVLHAFLVADLLDDNFRFYVDVRKGGSLYSNYIFRLYPDRGNEDGSGFVLNASEYVSFEIDGLEGVNISAVASFKNASVGEVVEVGGSKELVPRGPTPRYDSLDITIYGFSMSLDEKIDLSATSPNEEELLSLAKYRSGYILKGRIWNNKKFVNAIRSSIRRFESKFLSSLPNSCFLSREGEKYSALMDKKFLLNTIELIFRESIGVIKERLNKCLKGGEDCEFKVFIEVDEEKYGKDTIRITRLEYRPSFIRTGVTSQKSKDLLREIFEERTLYSKFIDSLGESNAKLCFDHDGRNKVEIDVDLPLHENKIKELRRKSYLGFINWSLRNLGEIREEQAELYSVFLDLVPHDPNSVRFLHSKGIYDKTVSKIKRVIHNLEEALIQGTIQISTDLKLGIKSIEKENGICILPNEGPYFIADLTVGDSFTYRRGKGALDIVVYDDYL